MLEAKWYEKAADRKAQCHLCAHECLIDPGKRGICQVRENREGTLYSLVYGKLIAQNDDPIEKKPLFHFLPGTRSFSIATVGCNFQCLHCQNYDISQYPRLHSGMIRGEDNTPEEVVTQAVFRHAASISYTYTEPTIFLEFAQDVARRAREEGLRNVFVSNGFMTETSARAAAEFLDANNIDLKSIKDDYYRKICKAKVKPILDTIRLMKEAGVWLEVTTLIIPGVNDSEAELKEIAHFIKDVGVGIPWHVTAFYPTYKMMDRQPTPPATLRQARAIGLEAGLRYVYTGNIPGEGGENTYCYACQEPLIERFGYTITRYKLKDGQCPKCQAPIDGVWK
jgi:pyruvate formate lyase activating enzyme